MSRTLAAPDVSNPSSNFAMKPAATRSGCSLHSRAWNAAAPVHRQLWAHSGGGSIRPGSKRSLPLATSAADGRGGGGTGDEQASSSSGEDYAAAAQRLNRLLDSGRQRMTGRDLHQLLLRKWGRSYEARLHKRGTRVYFQVMWKFLEQASFHLSAEQYFAQLDAVAELLSEWGAADLVRRAIEADKSRGPGYTVGGSARCISIPLSISTSGARSQEWK